MTTKVMDTSGKRVPTAYAELVQLWMLRAIRDEDQPLRSRLPN